MATIEDVKRWYERDLARYANWDDNVQIIPRDKSHTHTSDVADEIGTLRLRLFTDNNWYTIYACSPRMRKKYEFPPGNEGAVADADTPYTMEMDNGYLGCGASSRKPRAGEDWHRGSDLADGPLTEETWHKIIGDIVSYELVRVHRTQVGPGIPDTPS